MAAQRLLTDSDVKKLPAPPHGNRITYDKEGTGQVTTKQTPVAGFGIRVTAAGARSFIIRYRTLAGKERRYTIGDTSTWNVAIAREAAKEILRKLPDGVDPLGEREAARKAEAGAKSVAAMCERFVEDHLPDLREKTRDDYKLMIDREILPALGKVKVAEVSFDDVRALHKKIGRGDGKGRARPYLANRVAALLSCMFNLASTRWNPKWCAANPVEGLKRYPEQKRKRYLSGEELERLTKVLAEHEDRQAANVIRLLLLTGARRGELLRMRWEDLNLKDGKWTKPGSTTKQKTDHEIPLSGPARQLLADLRGKAAAAGPVFADYGTDQLRYAWDQICRDAEIKGLRVHDLRHSYASNLVNAGFSLPVIGSLLGHSQVSTTARYAHLYDEVTREATERVGAIVAGAGKAGAEIVPHAKARR